MEQQTTPSTYLQVDHPDYYNQSGAPECIEAMEAVFGRRDLAVFCHINAFKYLYRAGHKGPIDTDIDKAKWYIERHNALSLDGSISINSVIDEVAAYNPRQFLLLTNHLSKHQ